MNIQQLKIYTILLVAVVLLSIPSYFYLRSGWIQYYAGNSFLKEKKYEQAVDAYQSALAQGISDRELYLKLGDALNVLHQFPQAVSLYQEYLQKFPDDRRMRMRLAKVLGYMGDFEKAEIENRKLIQKGSGNE